MNIFIDGFYVENEDLYRKSLEVRTEIFVREFNFDKHWEFDGRDDKATHYVVLLEGLPIGCARWIEEKSVIRIDRFGILKKYRGLGLGFLLMKYVKNELKASSKRIELLSTEEFVVFFIQQGFKDSKQIEEIKNKKVRVLNL